VQQVVADIPTERWLDVMAGVAAALGGQAAAVGEDLYNICTSTTSAWSAG